jgi:hypothetical protein
MHPDAQTRESPSQVRSVRPNPRHELGVPSGRLVPSHGGNGCLAPQVRRPIPPEASPKRNHRFAVVAIDGKRASGEEVAGQPTRFIWPDEKIKRLASSDSGLLCVVRYVAGEALQVELVRQNNFRKVGSFSTSYYRLPLTSLFGLAPSDFNATVHVCENALALPLFQ